MVEASKCFSMGLASGVDEFFASSRMCFASSSNSCREYATADVCETAVEQRSDRPTQAARTAQNFIIKVSSKQLGNGPAVRSQSVTNDGCPIQARFWLEWDSTAFHRSLSTGNRSSCPWHLHPVHSGVEVCSIPLKPKNGLNGAPVIRYGAGRL